MKAFLLVFDPSQVEADLIKKGVDRMPAIANWYAFFGNTMCLASELDAKDLSTQIRLAFPDLRFIVTEVDPEHKGGWLPRSLWRFLRAPQAARTEAA